MILLRTGSDTQAVGIVQSAGALVGCDGGNFSDHLGRDQNDLCKVILLGWILSEPIWHCFFWAWARHWSSG